MSDTQATATVVKIVKLRYKQARGITAEQNAMVAIDEVGEYASKLERELTAAQAENERLRSEIKESNGKLAQVRDAWMRAENDLQTSMEDAKGRYKECEKLREKRDTLTAAVNALLAAIEQNVPDHCTCHEDYVKRNMTAPDCEYCNCGTEVHQAAEAVRAARGGVK